MMFIGLIVIKTESPAKYYDNKKSQTGCSPFDIKIFRFMAGKPTSSSASKAKRKGVGGKEFLPACSPMAIEATALEKGSCALEGFLFRSPFSEPLM